VDAKHLRNLVEEHAVDHVHFESEGPHRNGHED
jgi:hypothetical protein